MSNDFSLVLGCPGYSHKEFSLCAGTFNVIINFAGHFEQEQSQEIMDFLDYACSLFDRPMGDWNKITNTIKLFREKFKLIDDNKWEALHIWLPQHKRCGAYLRLILNAEIHKYDDTQENMILPENLKP